MTRRLGIVGGGITGLAAAYEASGRTDTEVVLLERSQRLGGKVHTSEVELRDGAPLRVDEGADAFLARVPDAVRLCEELGLSDELTQPAMGRAKVFVDGELRFLPEQTVLGVPFDPDALRAAGLVSDEVVAAVAAELHRHGPGPTGDVAIGPFLAERYGADLVERVVGPLIGGINAGDVDELSLDAVTPQLAEAAREGDSLGAALARRHRAAAEGPVFHGLRTGTGRLVDALADVLDARGVDVRTDAEVISLRRIGDGWQLGVDGPGGDGVVDVDAVVLSSPAPDTAELLTDVCPPAADELAAISHSSVTLVTLVHRSDDVPCPLDASGFLVPRRAGLLLTAASWGSTKWSHWDDGRHVVLRVSAGRTGDDRQASMTDEELVDALSADLRTTMGIEAAPVGVRVSRWPLGFAQYGVGHLDRVDRIESALRTDAPGVLVAGAPYRGLGLPACIRQGRSAAAQLLAS